MTEKRVCPHCGIEFVPKRTNQIFTNSNCRIAYNNKKNNDRRKLLAPITRLQQNNFNIISSILGNDLQKVVHKEYLRGAGFSFSVFTSIQKDENTNKLYYSLFHFYYFKFDDNHYKIVNNG